MKSITHLHFILCYEANVAVLLLWMNHSNSNRNGNKIKLTKEYAMHICSEDMKEMKRASLHFAVELFHSCKSINLKKHPSVRYLNDMETEVSPLEHWLNHIYDLSTQCEIHSQIVIFNRWKMREKKYFQNVRRFVPPKSV